MINISNGMRQKLPIKVSEEYYTIRNLYKNYQCRNLNRSFIALLFNNKLFNSFTSQSGLCLIA